MFYQVQKNFLNILEQLQRSSKMSLLLTTCCLGQKLKSIFNEFELIRAQQHDGISVPIDHLSILQHRTENVS